LHPDQVNLSKPCQHPVTGLHSCTALSKFVTKRT
jgi:hypothetical protein